MKRGVFVLLTLAMLLTACQPGEAASASAQNTAQPPFENQPTPAPTAQVTKEPQVELQVEVAAPAATSTPVPTPEASPTPTPTPEPTPEPELGVLAYKFADKFVEGTPVITDMSYQSDKLAIFITKETDKSKTISREPYTYYLADVYLQNMEDFRAGFAVKMDFKYKYIREIKEIAEQYDALFAVSGDYIRHRDTGVCLRNGVLYRDTPDPSRDVGVVFLDGHMETYEAQNAPIQELLANENVWHIIGFGPALLDEEGQPKTVFNTRVAGKNPRCAIGYFEPGHYCFLMVEGRSEKTAGLRMSELSKLMHQLGCVRAFNLDGGATASMYFNGKILNDNGHMPREVHDIFYIPKG